MKADAKKILEDAMQLEPATRAFIAESLLESLDFEQDFEVSPAWRAEIQRRRDEVDRGTAKLVDSDSVIAELRARTNGRRTSEGGEHDGLSLLQGKDGA